MTRRVKPIANRLTSTDRTELPTPGGLELAGDPIVGAHLEVSHGKVGTVTPDGQATTESRSHRRVVAVTRTGQRVPFDPDVWARWLRATNRGMGAFA